MTQFVWVAAERTLVWVIHHLVVDGMSWRILLPDLEAAYRGEELEPVPVPFRQWALDLAAQATGLDRVAELSLWTAALADHGPALGTRPLDPRRDLLIGMRRMDVSLSAGLTEALLTRVPAAFHAGVDDVLLAALAAAVTRWRRSGGLPIEIEGHGRAS